MSFSNLAHFDICKIYFLSTVRRKKILKIIHLVYMQKVALWKTNNDDDDDCCNNKLVNLVHETLSNDVKQDEALSSDEKV